MSIKYQEPVSSVERDLVRALRGQAGELPAAGRFTPGDTVLGMGQYGTVTTGMVNKIPVAAKTISSDAPASERARFLQEIFIMRQFDNPNILRVIAFQLQPMILVLELCSHDLRSYLRKHGPEHKISMNVRMRFSMEVSMGLEYLKEVRCIHRDIAARNILLTKGTCKIGDFGMSSPIAQEGEYYKSKGGKLPLRWAALETMLYRKYTFETEVWAFGVLLYEIFSNGGLPYPHMSNTQLVEAVERGYRLPPPSDTPAAVYDIMLSSWSEDPLHRPDISEVRSALSRITRQQNFLPADPSTQPVPVGFVSPDSTTQLSTAEAYEYAPPPVPARPSLGRGEVVPSHGGEKPPPAPPRPSLGDASAAPVPPPRRSLGEWPRSVNDEMEQPPPVPRRSSVSTSDRVTSRSGANSPRSGAGSPVAGIQSNTLQPRSNVPAGMRARRVQSMVLDDVAVNTADKSREAGAKPIRPTHSTRERLLQAAVAEHGNSTTNEAGADTAGSGDAIPAWLVSMDVPFLKLNDWFENHSKNGTPGSFLVYEVRPGQTYLLFVVLTNASFVKFNIEKGKVGDAWTVNKRVKRECPSLAKLISSLKKPDPEIEWYTPLLAAVNKQSLFQFLNPATDRRARQGGNNPRRKTSS
eukprot:m.331359 g.331359  ORF g.331359 m.331359 type:complete len:636 (-) comp20474_c0_seq3:1698-3605(-)